MKIMIGSEVTVNGMTGVVVGYLPEGLGRGDSPRFRVAMQKDGCYTYPKTYRVENGHKDSHREQQPN